MKTLDSRPLRLYLYFGFAANNKLGHSWPSIETIAKYFGKQTRTIDYWIQQLVEAGLVYRERDTQKSSTTYLVPYGDTFMRQRLSRVFEEDNQDIFDNLIDVIEQRRAVYGSIVGVFHLFH
ncbi:helix-turn-helix domain-containing protein [Alicyclobacillus sp. TC]|uniref:Transcriptional regulator n=1 Tax=Alicyclobacillus tolerans TaxID=90970 RepID=A0ABT9LZ20_9BACL|nr:MULTISPECIES: helix-turn-helix domain-containing protein [Alicyclobacillus]MDP9729509.1 putative transcriptional regulator [Alicyclobacillus tengchongensis]QRF22428.1 helix-turn-helix domain-containing protein [Alicyclobacillus sp. TC]